METIKGVFQKSFFLNMESGKASFLLKPDKDYEGELEKGGLIKVFGDFCLSQKYLPIEMDGEWRSTEYGKEFAASEVRIGKPDLANATMLVQNLGINISYRDVRMILLETGTDILSKVYNTYTEGKICQRCSNPTNVVEVFSKLRSLQDELGIFKMFRKYESRTAYENSLKVIKRFPNDTMKFVKERPYLVMEKADIPFSLMDKIAVDNGTDIMSIARIQAILYHCIKRETQSGNVYMRFKDLCKSAEKIQGGVASSTIIAALKDHPYIVKEPTKEDIYYEKDMLRDEMLAAKEFARIMYTRRPLDFREEYVDIVEKEIGRPFGQQQRSAFNLLRSTGFKLLTGDPGTGKTTTLNGMLRCLEIIWEKMYERKPKIALCAPSGRAAQRMKETTKRNALTVHKLLEYQPFGGSEYYKDGNDPVDADIIVVDEVSMLGLSTFSKLEAAIKSASMVILVGDVNQLQSVEPGSVLADIIKSGYVDSCHLTEVFRQSSESLININAKKIMQGDETLLSGPDFEFIHCRKEDTPAALETVVRRLIMEAGNKDKVQVLSPVRKGSCGVQEGNMMLQKIFNSQKSGMAYGMKKFKLHDRVIMMSNNYALNYFNGDIGFIRDITPVSMTVEINGNDVIVPKENYGDMELAYNCTVHKSQGSEYEYLVIVLQEEARNMLDQNLFYTAVTRGKKKVCVLYEGDTVSRCIRTKRKENRNSLLVERINREFQLLAS